MKNRSINPLFIQSILSTLALCLILGLSACGGGNSGYSSNYSSNPFETDPELRRIDQILDRHSQQHDSPRLRELYRRCRNGDMRACDEEIRLRNQSIRQMDMYIDQMNTQYGDDWVQSFGY